VPIINVLMSINEDVTIKSDTNRIYLITLLYL